MVNLPQTYVTIPDFSYPVRTIGLLVIIINLSILFILSVPYEGYNFEKVKNPLQTIYEEIYLTL
jgi:hypothetical protein